MTFFFNTYLFHYIFIAISKEIEMVHQVPVGLVVQVQIMELMVTILIMATVTVLIMLNNRLVKKSHF